MTKKSEWSRLGCGLGLRSQHYPVITQEWPRVDWFEAITENYMDSGGRPLAILEEVRRHYPVALHGVSMSLGSKDPLNLDYLSRLKTLVQRIDPAIVSDHLCWSGVGGYSLHDLLPLPYTEEALYFLVERIGKVQEAIGRKILIENVSTYITYKHSTMPEWEFLSEIASRAGCGILLDLNNIYVNAANHGFDATDYLNSISPDAVGQFHLAGHTDMGDYLFDTHSKEIIDPVWKLYQKALERFGPVSTLIEWDEDIPAFPRLMAELEKARVLYEKHGRVVLKDAEIPARKHTLVTNSVPLEDVQTWMKSRILGQEESGKLEEILNKQGKAEGIERVSVYAGGYLARMRDSLVEAYPAIRHILGENVFTGLTESYIREFPSKNYNLNHAGKKLPEFLSAPVWKEKFPFLPDLARLEWSVTEAFHAFEGKKMSTAAFSAISPEDWEKTRLRFQPSMRVVRSDWPILDIWHARHTPVKELSIDLIDRPQNILIVRQGLEVICELLESKEALYLIQLAEGRSLGDGLETVSPDADEDLPLSEWFGRWNALGLVTGLEKTSPSPR